MNRRRLRQLVDTNQVALQVSHLLNYDPHVHCGNHLNVALLLDSTS